MFSNMSLSPSTNAILDDALVTLQPDHWKSLSASFSSFSLDPFKSALHWAIRRIWNKNLSLSFLCSKPWVSSIAQRIQSRFLNIDTKALHDPSSPWAFPPPSPSPALSTSCAAPLHAFAQDALCAWNLFFPLFLSGFSSSFKILHKYQLLQEWSQPPSRQD